MTTIVFPDLTQFETGSLLIVQQIISEYLDVSMQSSQSITSQLVNGVPLSLTSICLDRMEYNGIKINSPLNLTNHKNFIVNLSSELLSPDANFIFSRRDIENKLGMSWPYSYLAEAEFKNSYARDRLFDIEEFLKIISGCKSQTELTNEINSHLDILGEIVKEANIVFTDEGYYDYDMYYS